MKVIERHEGTIVPEGWSVTETNSSWYLRYKNGDRICTVRISKTITEFPKDKMVVVEVEQKGDK